MFRAADNAAPMLYVHPRELMLRNRSHRTEQKRQEEDIKYNN